MTVEKSATLYKWLFSVVISLALGAGGGVWILAGERGEYMHKVDSNTVKLNTHVDTDYPMFLNKFSVLKDSVFQNQVVMRTQLTMINDKMDNIIKQLKNHKE
jgi:hypothetical protein